MNQHYLQLYADFIVKVGVNVQPRQNFIIRCPVTMPEFGHACVKAGYEAGSKNCIVRWEDDKLSRLHYEYAKEEDLAAMKPYELRSPPQISETLAGIHDERPCTVVCGRCSGTVLGRKSVPRHPGGGSDGKAVGTHL